MCPRGPGHAAPGTSRRAMSFRGRLTLFFVADRDRADGLGDDRALPPDCRQRARQGGRADRGAPGDGDPLLRRARRDADRRGARIGRDRPQLARGAARGRPRAVQRRADAARAATGARRGSSSSTRRARGRRRGRARRRRSRRTLRSSADGAQPSARSQVAAETRDGVRASSCNRVDRARRRRARRRATTLAARCRAARRTLPARQRPRRRRRTRATASSSFPAPGFARRARRRSRCSTTVGHRRRRHATRA